MKKSIFSSLVIILFLYSGFVSGQELEWVKTISVKSESSVVSQIFNLQTDKKGDIAITGSFGGDTLFLEGGKKLFRGKEHSYPSDPNTVKFLAKYGGDGNIKWAKESGFQNFGILSMEPYQPDGEFAIDSSDNISIGSEFYPMAKFAGNGSLLFSKDSTNSKRSSVVRAADANGNTYIASFLYGNVDFDYGFQSQWLSPESMSCWYDVCSEIAVGKYDASGNIIWVKKVGPIGDTAPKTIKIDALGNIYVLRIRGAQDYILKFDNSGNLLWEKMVGSDLLNFEIFNSNIYLVEKVRYTSDVQFSKYDLGGNLVLQKKMTTSGAAVVHSFSVQKSGLYVTGLFQGTMDFDPSDGFNQVTLNSTRQFVAKYDLNFNLSKVNFLGFETMNTKIDIDLSGNIILYGQISNVSGDVDLGPGVTNISASGLQETFFIAKYSQPKEKSAQSISWDQIGNKTIEDKEIEIHATGGASGNPVRLRITTMPSSGVATISGNTITVLGPGDVTVWATQDGNDDYFAAFDLSQTFNISVVSSLSSITKEQIIVFPNPSKEEFYLTGNSKAINKIEMTDLQGKFVSFNKEWSGEGFKVSLKENKSGIYLLKVYSDEKVEYKKITIE